MVAAPSWRRGRVTNATGVIGEQGTLESNAPFALGTGPITLRGGTLNFNFNAGTNAEIVGGVDITTHGPGNGYDILVDSAAISNGAALPVNRTSTIGINSGNAAINSLTVNAPQISITGNSVFGVKGTTLINQDTIINTAGGRLFLFGKLDAGANTITKIGANDIVLENTEAGGGQNQVGLWKVYGGTINPRVAAGASNPLGNNVTVELNGGTTGANHLLIHTDGNGTSLSERVMTFADTTLRYGSLLPVTSDEFVSSGASRTNVDRILANNSNKTVVLKQLEVGGVLGSPHAYFTGGNNDTFLINGTTTFVHDLYLQNDVQLTLNGVISGNGTFVKRQGTTTWVNADNTSGYDGGTIISGAPLLLGSFEGNQATLSDTAKLGRGHVMINPNGQFQINSAGNLQAGQNIYVSSNLNDFGVLRLAANLTLEQVNFRSAGLGGTPTTDNYYLSAINPSGGVLALNTVYTQALDMGKLGDGMWFLGSTSNAVGANGSYDAATLKPGANNTYRLGGGGSTLFFGSNGATNVLTNVSATVASNVIVGAPMSLQNNGPLGNGAGTVVLLGNQNYTGSTLINRGSVLDVRGSLATSGMEVYGGLNFAGEATVGSIPLTLRPGALLRFDNTSAGVPALAATQGRWNDSTPIDLNNATLRMQGNAAVEVTEAVGTITASGGASLEMARGVIGRGVELTTPGIVRNGAATVTFAHTGDQLGSDERVLITGTLPTVTNGMVAPWMTTTTNVDFLTYNTGTGFSKAGFTNIQTGGTTAATLNLTTDRVLFNTATTTIGNGFDINAYAARLDASITLATGNNSTTAANRLILGSGGLIVNAGVSLNAGLWAGTSGTSELVIFNTNTLTIGDAANPITSGQIRAGSLTKSGAGTLALVAQQQTFGGDINLNQGQITLNFAPSAAVTGPQNARVGGSGNTIFMNGANTQLNLLAGNDNSGTNLVTFNQNVVISDYNPIVQFTTNRSGGNISNQRSVIGGNFTFGENNTDAGQIARFTSGGNGFDFQIGSTANNLLTLKGKSSIVVDNGGVGNQPDVFVASKVTGSGTLVKGRIDGASGVLELSNVTSLNDFTGGTLVAGGTLRVFAKAPNVGSNVATEISSGGLGTGGVTMIGGTLDVRLDSDIGSVKTGTYVRNGTTITVTMNGHAFSNGQQVIISSIAGQTAGTFTVNVTDGNTFTYPVTDAGGTSGSVSAEGPDGQLEYVTYGTVGQLPSLIVNGASTVNLDRTGLFTGGANKQLAFSTLDIGSQPLTVSGGNGYGLTFVNSTTLKGNLFLNNTVDTVFGGDISDGGGGVIVNKIGQGTMWVNGANNLVNGGVYINAGRLDFGDRLTASAGASLGTSDLTINPGAEIVVRGLANINSAQGQQIILNGTAYSPAVLLPTIALSQADAQSLIQPSVGTTNGVQIIAFNTGISQNLDQSTIGSGRIFFGENTNITYTGTGTGSLTPGLASLPNNVIGNDSPNRVYRLGGRSTNTLTIDLAGTGKLSDVGGPTNLQVGSLANLGLTGNWGLGQVLLTDLNDYTGDTIVTRGSLLRFNTAPNATSGPLGAPGTGAIHAYGVLTAEGSATFAKSDNSANAYNNLVLHPGSELRFNGVDATVGNTSNRWHDNASIALNGSLLTAQTFNGVVNASETVGAVSFERGARLQALTQSTAQITLNLASLTRVGTGTLMLIPSNVNRLGLAPTANSERVLVTSGAPSNVAGTNMLPGYFGVQLENRFAKYGATGFAPVADSDMVGVAAALPSTAILNVQANATLLDNPNIFALRLGAFTLNSITGANNDSTITFSGSGANVGGIITSGNGIINPNLKFGVSGGNEALINTVGSSLNGVAGSLTVNGTISAAGVTKFGANTLVITNDQSDAARGTGNGYSNGWVVNEGALQLGTFGSAGNAVPGNTITLNGSQLGAAQLNLRAQPGNTLVNYTYSSGRIIAVDNAVIDFDPGTDDRVHTISDVEIRQAGGNSVMDALLRVANARNRTILSAGQLILTNNAILNVDSTVTASSSAVIGNNSGNLTNGVSAGMSIASIAAGSSRFTKWGDGELYIRGASSGYTGAVTIDQGAVYVTNNGSLGSGSLQINRFGVLDVGVANFVPTNSSVTYGEIGAVERWSVDGARTGTLNLGPATLQIAANQSGTSTVILNGGGIEGWLRSDDVLADNNRLTGVFRNLGANISLTLAGDSFVGTQYYQGANGLDMGKQTNSSRPMDNNAGSGVLLEIKGVISGPGALTKVGLDTVTLSGANTYTGRTNVYSGKLLLGRSDALPTTGTVTTRANAVLDLNGYDQTVGKLMNDTIPGRPSSTSGFVSNSAATVNTLSVGNGATGEYAYAGVIQNNIALNKVGPGDLRLTNINTYVGKTTISAGKLVIASEFSLGAAPSSPVADQITINGGTLAGFDTFSIQNANRGITLGAAGGSFEPANATTMTIARGITGTGSLTKTGPGTLVLGGMNTYTGATNVSAGVLRVTGSLDSGSLVTVNGGLLNGTGTVGSVIVNSPGAVGAGGELTTGTLNLNNLTVNVDALLHMKIQTSAGVPITAPATVVSDKLLLGGNLDLIGNPTLDLVDVGADLALPLGTALTLVDYSGAWNGGTLKYDGTLVADDATFALGANAFRLDYNGGVNGKSVTITTVAIANQAPNALSLSPGSASVLENQPAGTFVATIVGFDPDAGQTLTYSLRSGVGSTDNASFQVVGNQLQTTAPLDFDSRSPPSYSIRLRATDNGTPSRTIDKVFTVKVDNVNEPPAIGLIADVITDESTATAAIPFQVTDPDIGDSLSVSVASSDTSLIPLTGIVITGTTSARTIKLTPIANKSGTVTITLSTTDGTLTATRSFLVTVNPVNLPPTFVRGADRTHPHNTTALQTVNGWATSINDQDPDVVQQMTFNADVVSGIEIFTTPPSISPSGTLTYTPNGVAGVATVSVTLTDDATAGGVAETSAEQIFTITVEANTDLGALALSEGTLSPVFAAGTSNYTATVPNTTSTITLTPSTVDPNATVTVNGSLVDNGQASSPISLNVGANAITLVVTAVDSATKTYVVTVTRATAPEITIEQPVGVNLISGVSSAVFADQVSTTTSAPMTFTVKNEGTAPLTLTGASISGGDVADFSINTSGWTPVVPAGGSTTFTATFTPHALGAHSTTLQLISNDADEGTFTFTLSGTGASSLAVADQSDSGVVNDVLVAPLNITGTAVGTRTISRVTDAVHGTATVLQDGTYRYKATTGYLGTDSFTYQVMDDATLIGTATVNIVIVRRPPNWSWESGANLPKQKGLYTPVFPAVPTPGSRSGMASWSDNNGNLFVFGGNGFGEGAVAGLLNDLWQCDTASGAWVHLKGSKVTGAGGSYGALGLEDSENVPGARSGATTWRDQEGNLWLFGGIGRDSSLAGSGPLNDLWKYNPSTSMWTWVAGPKVIKTNGNYTTAPYPGARSGAVAWTSADGTVYLFGGNGLPETGTAVGLLNDLWKYNPGSNQWAWVKGSKLTKALAVYGTKGAGTSDTTPGARVDSVAWTGTDGMLWLFGGSNNNDLWKYDINANTWTWMRGANKAAAVGVYGQIGVSSATNEPGGRSAAMGWVDLEGALCFFGGLGAGVFDDVWRYTPGNNQWTWIKGSSKAAAPAIYGTPHLGEVPNTPGARQLGAVARDASGDPFIFGGLNGANNFNSLFRLDVPTAVSVQTLAEANVTDTDATINGSVNPNGINTSAFLRYASRVDMGDAVLSPVVAAGDGTAEVPLTSDITGLTPGTRYYYQVVVTTAFGQQMSAVRSFVTTGTAPATTVRFASYASTISESVGVAIVKVVLSSPSPTQFTVPFSISGTAATVTDFTLPNPLSVSFGVGQSVANIAIPIVNDNVADLVQSKTIIITLGTPTPSGAPSLGNSLPHTITLNDNEQGITVSTPQSQIVALGSTTTFSVTATGSGPLSYQWKKGTAKIAGATSPTYTITNTPSTAFGLYSVEVSNNTGKVTSLAGELVVVDTKAETLVTAGGGAINFSVLAYGAPTLNYTWLKNGGSLNGQNLKSLKDIFAPSSSAVPIVYTCEVSKPGVGAFTSGAKTVYVVTQVPIVTPVAALKTGVLGSYYEHQILYTTAANRAPKTFTVTGLAGTGLTVSPTGLISGKPIKVVTNLPISIIATNPVGPSTKEDTFLTIKPVPTGILGVPSTVAGSYVALVARNPLFGGNHGGRLDLTTNVAGTYTAKLTIDGKTTSVLGNLTMPLDGSNNVTGATGLATFVRAGLPTLVLDFSLGLSDNSLLGHVVAASVGASADVTGYRSTFNLTLANASAYTDTYNFFLEKQLADLGDLEIPQGNGVGSFKVTGDGKVTCAGSTADGLAYTSAGFVSDGGDVIIYAPFTISVGSLMGTAHINPDTVSTAPVHLHSDVRGTLSWSKNAAAATSTNYAYRSGFTPRTLTIIGGKYIGASAGGVVRGLTDVASKDTRNAQISFDDGGLLTGQVPTQLFTISNLTLTALTQTVTMPVYNALLPINPNPNKVTFALAAAPLGQFSGTFTVPHPVTTLTRAAKFTGMIVWDGNGYQSPGYFLLSQLPQSGETIAKTAVLSGRVLVEPYSPGP